MLRTPHYHNEASGSPDVSIQGVWEFPTFRIHVQQPFSEDRTDLELSIQSQRQEKQSGETVKSPERTEAELSDRHLRIPEIGEQAGSPEESAFVVVRLFKFFTVAL